MGTRILRSSALDLLERARFVFIGEFGRGELRASGVRENVAHTRAAASEVRFPRKGIARRFCPSLGQITNSRLPGAHPKTRTLLDQHLEQTVVGRSHARNAWLPPAHRSRRAPAPGLSSRHENSSRSIPHRRWHRRRPPKPPAVSRPALPVALRRWPAVVPAPTPGAFVRHRVGGRGNAPCGSFFRPSYFGHRDRHHRRISGGLRQVSRRRHSISRANDSTREPNTKSPCSLTTPFSSALVGTE